MARLSEILSGVPLMPPLAAMEVGGAAPTRARIPFSLEAQKASNWCWAAVAVSVETYYGRNGETQCRLAGRHHGVQGCCGQPVPDECDRAAKLSEVLTELGSLRDFLQEAASTDVLSDEIRVGNPVCCHISWTGLDAGHFVVVVGFEENGAVLDVVVEDPAPVDQGRVWSLPYDELVSQFGEDGSGAWDFSYLVK